jgi:hemerythrin-like domain-containing protein
MKSTEGTIMEKTPTEILEEEHHFIQKVVGAMAVIAERLEMGQEVEAETLRNIVEFMRTFADKCHHGKEETHLFPVLERKGVPVRGCPLAVLMAEHQRGRALVKGLATTAEAYVRDGPSAKKPLLENLRGITGLYPDHMWKEDYLLFPMTNKILTPGEQKELYDKFEMVERAIGAGVHHRFEQLAEKLKQETQRA